MFFLSRLSLVVPVPPPIHLHMNEKLIDILLEYDLFYARLFLVIQL